MNAVAEALLTAEEFEKLPDNDVRMELVRGRVIALPLAGFERGAILAQLAPLIRPYLTRNNLGRFVGRVGVILARNPDTVRCPDAAYYSFSRIPVGVRPRGFPAVLPELVFEVRSPEDRWNEVMVKVGEYLAAVVNVVVIDPGPQRVHIFEVTEPPRQLGPADTFELPSLWPGLAFPVADLFD
jgi:Uma2 family endonuclease